MGVQAAHELVSTRPLRSSPESAAAGTQRELIKHARDWLGAFTDEFGAPVLCHRTCPNCAKHPVLSEDGIATRVLPQADNVSHWLKSRTGAARSGVEWTDRLRLVG